MIHRNITPTTYLSVTEEQCEELADILSEAGDRAFTVRLQEGTYLRIFSDTAQHGDLYDLPDEFTEKLADILRDLGFDHYEWIIVSVDLEHPELEANNFAYKIRLLSNGSLQESHWDTAWEYLALQQARSEEEKIKSSIPVPVMLSETMDGVFKDFGGKITKTGWYTWESEDKDTPPEIVYFDHIRRVVTRNPAVSGDWSGIPLEEMGGKFIAMNFVTCEPSF